MRGSTQAHKLRLGNGEPLGGFVLGRDRDALPQTGQCLFQGREVRHGYEHKSKVLSLVDRDSGKVRSMVVDDPKTRTVAPIVRENVAIAARLMPDEARHYKKVGREFADHQVVRHSAGEYGRGDAYTNTIEGYFSIFKRGMKGVYQHCGEQHLHRYLAEFDFRYNERDVTDAERAATMLVGATRKRLMYRDSSGGHEPSRADGLGET